MINYLFSFLCYLMLLLMDLPVLVQIQHSCLRSDIALALGYMVRIALSKHLIKVNMTYEAEIMSVLFFVVFHWTSSC